MRFEKWQALGNDYIIVEAGNLPFELTAQRIRRICEPHLGVGGDGILLLRPGGDAGALATLEIYNPDGSRAELSGNGVREAILYLKRRKWTESRELSLQTDSGLLHASIDGKLCRVDMGTASTASKDFPTGPPSGASELLADGRQWRFNHVSIGNPQCSISVKDLEELAALDLGVLGPPIEANELFPNRTNVSWYAELAPASPGGGARIRARIFERGVGETMSSGTGATGAAIAYLLGTGGLAAGADAAGAEPMQHAKGRRSPTESGRVGRSDEQSKAVTVVLDGGELLVEVSESLHVHLTGWARPLFDGHLSPELIEELNETQ